MITIENKEMCCGCTACVNSCPQHCIEMKADAEGFAYPKVDTEKCIQCGLCTKACPMTKEKDENSSQTKAFAIYAKEDEIREKSSSGGVFSLMAKEILSEGGCVFGCTFDSKFRAKHIMIEDASMLKCLQGSKYVQSDLSDSYKKVKSLLEDGRKVLFAGTSCQTEGLRTFLSKSYDTLFMVDIVCHGAPSPKVWEQYMKYQEEVHQAAICDVSFRDKKNGWKDYRIKLGFENGKTYLSRSWDDSYMKMFIKNYISRPSCYSCKFRTWHRDSDITLGDFWGIEHVLPEWNDDKGISLVMVHSKKGAAMLQRLSGKVEQREVCKEDAVKENQSVIAPNVVPKERAKFFECFAAKGYSIAMQRYAKDGFFFKVKNALKRLIK